MSTIQLIRGISTGYNQVEGISSKQKIPHRLKKLIVTLENISHQINGATPSPIRVDVIKGELFPPQNNDNKRYVSLEVNYIPTSRFNSNTIQSLIELQLQQEDIKEYLFELSVREPRLHITIDLDELNQPYPIIENKPVGTTSLQMPLSRNLTVWGRSITLIGSHSKAKDFSSMLQVLIPQSIEKNIHLFIDSKSQEKNLGPNFYGLERPNLYAFSLIAKIREGLATGISSVIMQQKQDLFKIIENQRIQSSKESIHRLLENPNKFTPKELAIFMNIIKQPELTLPRKWEKIKQLPFFNNYQFWDNLSRTLLLDLVPLVFFDGVEKDDVTKIINDPLSNRPTITAITEDLRIWQHSYFLKSKSKMLHDNKPFYIMVDFKLLPKLIKKLEHQSDK
jgi:hypothetical protein